MREPTKRLATIIANKIRGGQLKKDRVSMFSADRNEAIFEDIAITITTRINSSDLFYILIPDEKGDTKNS